MTFTHRRLHYLLPLWAFIVVAACSGRKDADKAYPATLQKRDSAAIDTSVVESSGLFKSEYEDPDRETWQRPNVVLSRFGALKGQLIADVGAGTGYFTFRLAAKGANVVAIDIDSNFLDHIAEESLAISGADMGTIETRITSRDSPSLEPGEVDGVLIVNTVYFLPQRVSYFRQIYAGLRPKGRLIVVDFKPERSPVAPADKLWVPSTTVINELKSAGFSIIEVDDKSLPYQYMIIATKPK